MHDEFDCNPETADVLNPAVDDLDLPAQLADPFGLAGDNASPDTSGEWGPLRQATLTDFKAAMADGDKARSVLLVNVLAELARIELGTVAAGSRRGQRALRTARLALARRLIARHLPEPELSAAMVAGLLGVSVRHLHMLFERTGKSFAKTVNAQRIRLSGQLLLETPPRPVTEIACACGFASPATFYRLFQITMKMSPGKFRAQGAQPGSAGAISHDQPASAHVTGK
jgi:AraC-like DNA-binding protein